MKYLLKYAWILIAVSIVSAGCAGINKDEGIKQSKSRKMEMQDRSQIEGLLSEYQESLVTSNAEMATKLYTEDGVFMPKEAPSAKGQAEIKGAYEFVFSQIQLNIEFFVDEIVIDKDIAYATTMSRGTTLIHATGETVPEENRELFVFEREDGVWKIARYMFNKTGH